MAHQMAYCESMAAQAHLLRRATSELDRRRAEMRKAIQRRCKAERDDMAANFMPPAVGCSAIEAELCAAREDVERLLAELA